MRGSWALCILLVLGDRAWPEEVTLFAAASLTEAMTDVSNAYRASSGNRVRLSFAASSVLARQIEAGAPADIFASANESWMDYLEARGLIDASTRRSPIGNRLVLIGASHFAPEIAAIEDLPTHLGDDRLAIGDPAHVPAGIYAKRALQSLGLWTSLSTRLALTDHVRATLALVDLGEAPLGIVYATDTRLSTRVKTLVTFPEPSHGPITYPFAIVGDGLTVRDRQHQRATRAFFDFMTGMAANEIYGRHGFVTRRHGSEARSHGT